MTTSIHFVLVLCSYYCFYYARLAGIVDVSLDLLSICCCWHMKLLHKICRLRQRLRLRLRLRLGRCRCRCHRWRRVVAALLSACLYYVFHLLRPSHSLHLSLPLLLVLIIVVALSLAFGFRRFSCNLPGKLLSTWATTTRFHFHSHSTIAFLLAWGSLPCPKNSARPLPASLPASCGVM